MNDVPPPPRNDESSRIGRESEVVYVEKKKRGGFLKWLAIGGFALLLLAGGCVAILATAASNLDEELNDTVDASVATSADAEDEEAIDDTADDEAAAQEATGDTAATSDSAGSDDEAEADEPSTAERDELGPVMIDSLPFGEAHTRDPGFNDAGWTVSIDDVVDLPVFAGEAEGCLAVVGTATLDSLEDGLTSNPFSFPEVVLVADGVQVLDFVLCDSDALDAEGMIRTTEAELTEGTTVTWYKAYGVPVDGYDFVAIEQTVYSADGAQVMLGERREPVSSGGPDDGPYSFGDAHTRKAGFTGAGWTVSIDDVVELNALAGDLDTCLAVIGTATLDTLDEGLTSNPFSFPEVVLIQDGVQNNDFAVCNTDDLDAQGMIQSGGASITEGTTITWYQTFGVLNDGYDLVAIEETVYEP